MAECRGVWLCMCLLFALLHDVKVSDHTQRLGCEAAGGYQKLKEHPFFLGIEWDGLPEQEPPKILPYLPSNTKDGEALKSDYDVSTPHAPSSLSVWRVNVRKQSSIHWTRGSR